ncbi:hypothetical protein ACFV16_01285 [Streptomyces massasporeus]|uniref:hypothetical protein n=1 Tax=Streptomyces massasporeus TaxID=67324 RepID=UPI00368A86B7
MRPRSPFTPPLRSPSPPTRPATTPSGKPTRTRARVAGADRPRLGLIQPTGELITAAALSLGAGWAVTRHEVPNLLMLAVLGIALPAMAGMALALIIRQEESPLRSARGWPVLLVPVVGGRDGRPGTPPVPTGEQRWPAGPHAAVDNPGN